jgi:hypothetical protein
MRKIISPHTNKCTQGQGRPTAAELLLQFTLNYKLSKLKFSPKLCRRMYVLIRANFTMKSSTHKTNNAHKHTQKKTLSNKDTLLGLVYDQRNPYLHSSPKY